MKQPYLRIINVSKRFDRSLALENVSLEIPEGEFVFLLGPSGCGKTTLLRIIAGLEEPTNGSIIQADQDVTRLPPAKRNFGIVFQSYALFPNLTVSQNIAYGLENRKESKQVVKKRVNELLELVGLVGYEERFPRQLSGGQQQRVALARALAISPNLLLLDEPLSALDARVRSNLRIEISRLQRRLGITTIMVSHDQEEALTMADRIVVIENGEIVQVGSPEEVYFKPQTPFVADFVGLMNFIPGVVIDNSTIQVGESLFKLEHDIEQSHGEMVSLAIRPERVQVWRKPLAGNCLVTNVHEVEFMGPFYRLHLTHGENHKLFAYMPPDNSYSNPISEGKELLVFLPPVDLRIYQSNGFVSH